MAAEEEVLGKPYDGRLMRRLVGYLRPYRGLVALSVLCLLIHSALQILGPLLTKFAIDRYLSGNPAHGNSALRSWFSPERGAGLAQVAFAYALMLAGVFVFEFAQTCLMQYTGQRAMFDLRRELMGHLQRLDIAYFDRNPVGRLVTRVTTDVDVLNELFASGLVTILGDLLVLSFIVVIMFGLSPMLTAVMLAVLPLVVLVTRQFRRTVQTNYRRIRVAIARINSFLQEHISGIAVLQLFHRERRAGRDFERINREHMDAYKETIIAYGWFYPAVEFLSFVTLAATLTLGGRRVLAGDLSIGVVVAFLQYGMRFFRPIQDLSEKYNILQGAMAAAERIFKLLDTEPSIRPEQPGTALPAASLDVEFDQVWFAYKDEDWVLRDLSFRIQPGEMAAFVGHTGAGKTTIISLLLRFYEAQRGVIRIGGVDIRQINPVELRSRFGVVLQDPYLLSGTIEENIRLGTPHITRQGVLDAASQVNLDGFLASLPSGVDQEIRERGNSLSTGQKQLISFARALAHQPQYLILDEATSSVDTETEMRVREALGRVVAGRTSIVIAHRLSTIQRASRILVMHRGRLRESGTHQELLAQGGIYSRLYQLQYREQEQGGLRTA